MKLLAASIVVSISLLELASADTFVVTNTQNGGDGSLREAVLAANSNAGPDEIVFSAVTGVITLTGSLPPVTDDLTITGPEASVLTIRGGGSRILTIAANKVVQLSHLTFANGRAPGNENGGAIENHGTLIASNSVFSNNSASGGFGGAVFSDGALELVDTTFSSNRVDGNDGVPGVFGGAVYSAAGSIAVTRCIFTGNAANGRTVTGYGTGEGFGGAMFLAAGSGSITFSNFFGNASVGGNALSAPYDPTIAGLKGGPGAAGSGALHIKEGSFVIEDSTFTGNSARGGFGADPAGDGGEARGAAITNVAGNVEVTRCTIASNEAWGGSGSSRGSTRRGSIGGAGFGGGIASLGGTLTVSNSTISGNKAFGADGQRSFNGADGGAGSAAWGGVASMGGSTQLTNCTIAANQANPGYGFYGPPYGVDVGKASGGIYANSATFSLKNNLFSGNFKHTVYEERNSVQGPGVVVDIKDTPTDGSGAVSSLGHNLFSTDVGITGLVASDLRNVAAPLGPLQDNGGPTQTHALPFGSPAIDAGDDSGAPATDQRGVVRSSPVDIGSFEGAVPPPPPPETMITSAPAELTNMTSATFTFVGNGSPGLGPLAFAYSLDGGAFTSAPSPVTLNALTDGTHTFSVRALDNVGGVDPTPAVFAWRVDTVAPDTTITAGPPASINVNTAAFTFAGSDDVTPPSFLSFSYSIDGGAFIAATSPVTLSGLGEGPHALSVRAIDAAGNLDLTPAEFAWRIDTIAPETTITSGPSGMVNSRVATFTFEANETDATFAASVDNGPFAAATSPLTLTVAADGPHTFSVRAVDAAGNVDATPAVRSWTVERHLTHEAHGMTGDAVPGAGEGRIPFGAMWRGFGVPAINDAGAVAFVGKWTSFEGIGVGIFVNDTLVAKAGDSTPLLGKATFVSFKDPVFDADGHVAFLATVSGPGVTSLNDSVLVTDAFGALEVVAREGATMAELGAPRLQRFVSISLVDGEVLLTAKLAGGSPLATDLNDDAAFRVSKLGGMTHVVREGDAFGPMKVKSFNLLASVAGSPGQNRGHAAGTATFLALLSGGTQALMCGSGGLLTPLVMQRDTVSDTALPEAKFKSFGPVAGDGSRLAFRARSTPGSAG